MATRAYTVHKTRTYIHTKQRNIQWATEKYCFNIFLHFWLSSFIFLLQLMCSHQHSLSIFTSQLSLTLFELPRYRCFRIIFSALVPIHCPSISIRTHCHHPLAWVGLAWLGLALDLIFIVSLFESLLWYKWAMMRSYFVFHSLAITESNVFVYFDFILSNWAWLWHGFYDTQFLLDNFHNFISY